MESPRNRQGLKISTKIQSKWSKQHNKVIIHLTKKRNLRGCVYIAPTGMVFRNHPKRGRVGLSLFLIREDNSLTTQVIIQGFILQSAYNYKLLKYE